MTESRTGLEWHEGDMRDFSGGVWGWTIPVIDKQEQSKWDLNGVHCIFIQAFSERKSDLANCIQHLFVY